MTVTTIIGKNRDHNDIWRKVNCDTPRQRTGSLQCPHKEMELGEGVPLCIIAKSETSSVSSRNRPHVTRQLPQEEISSSCVYVGRGGGGSCLYYFPRQHTATPCPASIWSVGINPDFSRKLEECFAAVSKLISCIACVQRLIAVSLLHLLRLSQNVTLSVAKCRTVEKTGRK